MNDYVRGDVAQPGEAIPVFFRCPYDDVDKIKFYQNGDEKADPHFLADEFYRQKYPEAWDRYQRGASELEGQTPLDQVGWIDPARRNQMQAKGVRTLEMLAACNDVQIASIGGWSRRFRDRAAEEVSAKAKAAETDDLRAQLEELQAQMAALQEAPKRGGRKPAQEAAA